MYAMEYEIRKLYKKKPKAIKIVKIVNTNIKYLLNRKKPPWIEEKNERPLI